MNAAQPPTASFPSHDGVHGHGGRVSAPETVADAAQYSITGDTPATTFIEHRVVQMRWLKTKLGDVLQERVAVYAYPTHPSQGIVQVEYRWQDVPFVEAP